MINRGYDPVGEPQKFVNLNISKIWIGLKINTCRDSKIAFCFAELFQGSDLNVVWRFDNSSSVINAVTEGLGLSIVSRIQASKYVQGGLIKFIPIDTKVESYLNLLDVWKGSNQIVNAFISFIEYYVATSTMLF